MVLYIHVSKAYGPMLYRLLYNESVYAENIEYVWVSSSNVTVFASLALSHGLGQGSEGCLFL